MSADLSIAIPDAIFPDWQNYLAEVQSRCLHQGATLTPIRQDVLALLYQHPHGLKAYDLLAQMKQVRSNATPPTVYRALDFLMEQGLAHKIGRMNLFVACRHHSHQLPSLFLACPCCGAVSELPEPTLMQALLTSVTQAGHRLDSPEVEISAICPDCCAQGGEAH